MDLCSRQLWCWTGVAGAGNACVGAYASCVGAVPPQHAARSVSDAHLMAGRVVARCVARVESRRARGSLGGGGGCESFPSSRGSVRDRHLSPSNTAGTRRTVELLRFAMGLCATAFQFELSRRTRPSPSRHLIQATQRGLTLRPKEVASSNALRGCCTTAYLGLPRRAAAPNPGSASAVQTAPGRRPVTGHGSALACLDELCHPRPQRRANELQAGCVKGCGSCEETAAPAGAADAEDR